MGYRSCAAILMYGPKQDCEMVINLFMAGGSASLEDRQWFDGKRQEKTNGEGDHFVFWNFDDVKWYSACDEMKDTLFEIVNQINEAKEEEEIKTEHGSDYKRTIDPIAIEFIRMGEEMDDNQWDGSDCNENLLSISRRIEFPENMFEWKI